MWRVENEPACVHWRKGGSEWCTLSLSTEQGRRGCFNILLNVVFLLTLAGKIFNSQTRAPSRHAVSPVHEAKSHSSKVGSTNRPRVTQPIHQAGHWHNSIHKRLPPYRHTGQKVGSGGETGCYAQCIPRLWLFKLRMSLACEPGLSTESQWIRREHV